MHGYVVFNVELANPDLASICQLSVVSFEHGRPIDTWETLVNPCDYFDPFFVAMHGIQESDIGAAPTVRDLTAGLVSRLTNRVVLTHTAFDRVSLFRAFEDAGALPPVCRWLDSARVARRTWPEVARTGYGLEPVAKICGITFRHNRASEDARAAGEILAHAIQQTGLDLESWFAKVEEPLAGPIEQAGNPEGPLYGQTVVFTGALSLTRAEAARLAAEAGCNVEDGVNKRTTLLVVGAQDIRQLAGHDRSHKHRTAEARRAKGQLIRILGEPDFMRIVSLPGR